MEEKPTAVDLLQLARSIMRTELVHLVPKENRYEALMVANAMAIAARALENPTPDDDADMATLAAAIREGAHDGDGIVYDRLVAEVEARVTISNPRALQD